MTCLYLLYHMSNIGWGIRVRILLNSERMLITVFSMLALSLLSACQSNNLLWKNPSGIFTDKIYFQSFPYYESQNSSFDFSYGVITYNFGRSFNSPPKVIGGFINLHFTQGQTNKTAFIRITNVTNTNSRLRGFTDKYPQVPPGSPVPWAPILFSILVIDDAITGISYVEFKALSSVSVWNAYNYLGTKDEIPILFMHGFITQSLQPSYFQIKGQFQRVNSSWCQLTISNNSNDIMRYYYSLALFELPELQRQGIFLDYGWFMSNGVTHQIDKSPGLFDNIYFSAATMFTITSFSILCQSFNLTILDDPTALIEMDSGYDYVNATYLSFRSLCVPPLPLYYQDKTQCVANCSTGFIQNLTHPWVCKCQLVAQHYIINQSCLSCSTIFVGCLECFNSSFCKECNTVGYFVHFQQRCVCKDGYYLNGTMCLKCDPSCLTCVDKADFCLTCNESSLRYFIENRCDCVSIYSDCRNSSIPGCNPSQCSYLSHAIPVITSVIKDPTKNKLSLSMTLSPVNEEFESFLYNDIINFGLPNLTQIQYVYSNGSFNITIDYFDDLQSYQGTLQLNLTKVPLWYFSLAPIIDYQYTVSPNNNLASNFYSQSIYDQYQTLQTIIKVVIGTTFLVFVVGLFSSQLASTEMMAPLQISFLGLFILNHSDPLIEAFDLLKHSNGYDDLLLDKQVNAPDRIASIGFSSFLLMNLNITLGVVLMIPLALSFIFYQIHRHSTQFKIRMEKLWKVTLGESGLTAFIFTLYSFSSSLGIFCLYSSISSWRFYLSICEILVYFGLMGVLLWIFIAKGKEWTGEFKTEFNWNKFSQLYYLIPILLRLVIGVTMGVGNMHFLSGIIVLILLLVDIIIVSVQKPYIQTVKNARSITHNSLSFLITLIYVILSISGPSKSQGTLTYMPYIITGLLILNIIGGVFFISNEFVSKRRKMINKKEQYKQQEDQNSARIEMFRETVKAMNEHKSKNLIKKRET